MRTVAYEQMPGVGPGKFPKEVPLRDFVLDLPYLFSFDLIPPISVLNDLFSAGILDAGMSGGCRWDPFSVDQYEHDELVEALLALPDCDYKYVEVPRWVRNRTDWQIWTMEHVMEVPAQRHHELSVEIEKWTKLEKEARQKGDNGLAAGYLMRVSKASEELNEYLMPYIEKYHSRKSGS